MLTRSVRRPLSFCVLVLKIDPNSEGCVTYASLVNPTVEASHRSFVCVRYRGWLESRLHGRRRYCTDATARPRSHCAAPRISPAALRALLCGCSRSRYGACAIPTREPTAAGGSTAAGRAGAELPLPGLARLVAAVGATRRRCRNLRPRARPVNTALRAAIAARAPQRSMVKVPLLAAARAATHRSRGPAWSASASLANLWFSFFAREEVTRCLDAE